MATIPIAEWLAFYKLQEYTALFEESGYDRPDFLTGVTMEVRGVCVWGGGECRGREELFEEGRSDCGLFELQPSPSSLPSPPPTSLRILLILEFPRLGTARRSSQASAACL